jgi:alpha-L-rhamnosidase
MLKIIDLTIEYRKEPLGLDTVKPRFSWVLESDRDNTVQTQYRALVSLDSTPVWDSGLTADSRSVHIEYAGKPLSPRTRYKVQVEVQDNYGQTASAESWFETGLLSHENISAKWITHGFADDIEPCPVYRREFSLRGQIRAARIYASAIGVYELQLNGAKVGSAFFAPGWTSYRSRVQYQTYNITGLLRQNNLLEITVGNGWFKGIFGFMGAANHYGSRTAAIAQIEIQYIDGSIDTICTDEAWHYATGPRRYSEIYHGETIDNTFTPDEGGQAVLFDYPLSVLTGQESDPVCVTERLKAKELRITPRGEIVLDFGQNLVGVIEAKLHCPKGTKVVLYHAEVLDKDDNFYTENLRGAKAADTFICSGSEDIFIPAFTFHGFRYVKIEGIRDVNPDCFTACVLHTDMQEAGMFRCSHPDVTQLQNNIRWSQRGNFLDIPTDCPQRNERLGWTGDAQVFAATAAYNMNTALFFTKWLRDLAAEQTAERGVPHVIPNILENTEGAAAWSDAAVIVPWELYRAYGDIRVLQDQYPSMKAWVEYVRGKAEDKHLWQSGFQYGDWLALDKAADGGSTGATDIYLVSSAYYAWSTGITAKAAEALGYAEDAAAYQQLHDIIVESFQKEYITQTGRMVSETQTVCILTLFFDLAAPQQRERILESLLSNLAKHKNHLTTGFVGTPYLCHVLTQNGHHGTAGNIFLKHDFPSWLYAVDRGATTIWERWDSIKSDGSLNDPGMNSFNHYAYGSIGDWMYQNLGGLRIVEPGYKKSRIAPLPIKGITWARAQKETPYGRLACYWKCENHRMAVDIEVPVNTTAAVILPGKDTELTVGSGKYHYEYETDLDPELDRYTMESTFGELLDNPLAMRLLAQYAPGMADNPQIELARNLTIADTTSQMPEGGVELIQMIIEQLNAAEKRRINTAE